jgi:flavin-dependent dehydrogenase
LWAARTAAGFGLDVVVLEEHLAVGLPKHCSGWLVGCEFTSGLLDLLKESLPHQPVRKLTVYDAAKGDVLEEVRDTGWGGYLVRRELLDRELGHHAILSGARLVLGTRVKEFIRSEERVVGIRTSSSVFPEVAAEMIICADGTKSATNQGFARREIASLAESQTYAGIQMELAGVKEVNPGEIEIYEASDPVLQGRSLWPLGQGATMASFSSIEAFEAVKARRDNVLSQKLEGAFPLYVAAFSNRKGMGHFYSRLTKDGVIYVGEACGCSGIVHGMISGYYAAIAAQTAIQGGDAQAAGNYEDLLKNSRIYRTPFCYRNIKDYYGSYGEWLEQSKEIRVGE